MRKRNRPTSPRHATLAGSRAFREAALRSEIRRAYAVVVVIVLSTLLIVFRALRHELRFNVQMVGYLAMAILLALQINILIVAQWARRREKSIPSWFIIVTVVIECLIPTGMIISLIASAQLLPYAALGAPPLLAYGVLIAMTPLRLRPGLCVLAGTVCAMGYAGVVSYVTYAMGIFEPTTGLPRVAYLNSAAILFIAGLGSAWVAHELRSHFAAALDEAETRRQMDRIEQDMNVARSIQRALLPRMAPDIAGFDIAGWNRPADQTGGDYYDWQKLPDGNWIITVADVSGHGIGPALVTAACRAYVRASGDARGDLASLTSRINRLLADDLPEGRFVTMVSVLINPQSQPLALLSAGHGPIALYIGATGVVEDILPGDLPLAIEPNITFGPAQSVAMSPGDVLALVTDGVVEWCRHDAQGNRDDFGVSRLRDSLRRHAHLPAAAMIEAITADVTAFTHPAPQQDDLTMVIIRRVG